MAPIPVTARVTVAGSELGTEAHESKRHALYRAQYETTELRLLPRLVQPGDLAVDVGANIGLYTLALAALAGSRGRVVASEPSPLVRARLSAAVARAAAANVEILPYALGAAAHTATLTAPADDPGLGTLRRPAADGRDGSDLETFDVEVRRLDDLITDEIGFLKIDTEGWEGEVLAGASSLFDTGRIRCVLLELSPAFGRLDYAPELAARNGYTTYLVDLVASRLRTVPILRCVTPAEVGAVEEQRSLLVVREDASAAIHDLVPKGRG
ncbi:MAG TPA: FkbM family methyltransferase [Acidimicrobiales bacterium]|nr:FkbM family methyltransferase [Acidimicrobiales bacterium]